jgi:MFS family permease
VLSLQLTRLVQPSAGSSRAGQRIGSAGNDAYLQRHALVSRIAGRPRRSSDSLLVVIGTIIQTTAVNVGMLIAGRITAGLAIGVLLSTVPVYNAELAVPKHRGVIVGLFAVMASFGVLCSNWVGYACFFATGNAQWRIPLGCQAPFAVILCLGVFFLPESPRWRISHFSRLQIEANRNIVIKKDRGQEAYKSKSISTGKTRISDAHSVLMQVHGHLGDDFVNREFAQMHEQLAIEGQGGFMDCFRTTSARKRIALGVFINIFNNLGGTPVISVYQSQLFRQIGFPGLRTLFLSGFYGLAGFVGVIINIALVADRMGRKTSMCESTN